MEEWIKMKGFKAWWGSSRWVVDPAFLVFDAADRMAIGAKLYYHAKVDTRRQNSYTDTETACIITETGWELS